MRKILLPLLALVSASIALLACEVVLRAMAAADGVPWSSEEASRDARRIVTGMTESTPVMDELGRKQETREGRVVTQRNKERKSELHPYYGFDGESVPALMEKYLAWEASERSEDHLVVYVAGGSVSTNFMASKGGAIGELKRDLPRLPRFEGREVVPFVIGRPGHKQPQQLAKLAYLYSRGARPDIVINLDGYNEIHLAARNAEAEIPVSYPSFGHWVFLSQQEPLDGRSLDLLAEARRLELEATELHESLEGTPILASIITGRRALGRLNALQASWAETQSRLVDHLKRKKSGGPDDARSRQDLRFTDPVEEAVAVWTRSSRQMHLLCQANGARYLHVLQPTLHDEGSKPVHPQERERGMTGGLDETVSRGYDRLREEGQALKAEGIEFIDGSLLFEDVEDPLYYDRCHFNRKGNLLVLAAILRQLEG